MSCKRGGLGLTGGMADVGSLIDCLKGIHEGKASLKILDIYDEQRRQKYYTVTDVVSSTNLKRLFLPGDQALVVDVGLQRIYQASQDTATAKALFEVRKKHDPQRAHCRGFQKKDQCLIG